MDGLKNPTPHAQITSSNGLKSISERLQLDVLPQLHRLGVRDLRVPRVVVHLGRMRCVISSGFEAETLRKQAQRQRNRLKTEASPLRKAHEPRRGATLVMSSKAWSRSPSS